MLQRPGQGLSTAFVQYDFTYDKAGNLTDTRENQAAVAQFGALGPAASGLGIWTSAAFDALNRVTRYRHIDIPSGKVQKRTDYAYRPDGSVASVTRYAGAGVNPIGTSTATYDSMGRTTGITHRPSRELPAISYGYTYDAAGRMETMTTPEGKSTFTLDAADQLLSASRTGENYAYDKTGNRTSGGTQTGSGNRLAFDGTYRYAYDAEGNRTAKFKDTNAEGTLSSGDTDVTVYAYDQRNRLVAVSHVNAWTTAQATALGGFSGSDTTFPGSDLDLRYTYDFADRRIRRFVDTDGQAGVADWSVSFAAYAGDVRTLEVAQLVQILNEGRVIGFLGEVVQRNFYGNGQDEILAVDKITWSGPITARTPTTSTFWTFTDHQDSVRDIVSGNAADRGAVVEHRQYDSFGKIVAQTINAATSPSIDFGYAGRPLESSTGLSDNRARWYEPSTGRFINEDPSGFKGGDANLFRYVGNDPLDQVDPSGLAAKWAQQAARQSASAAAWGADGDRSVDDLVRLSDAAKNDRLDADRFAATSMGLAMLHHGMSGVNLEYAEKGFPVASRQLGASGAAEYTFRDGTRYTALSEPTAGQYAAAAATIVPLATSATVAFRAAAVGNRVFAAAKAVTKNLVDDVVGNYADKGLIYVTNGWSNYLPFSVSPSSLGRSRPSVGRVGAELPAPVSTATTRTPVKLAEAGEDLFVGGYGQVRRANIKSGLNPTHTPHHSVQDAVSSTSHSTGVSINMRKDLHALTRTYCKPVEEGLSLRQHLSKDVWDIKTILTNANYDRSVINAQLKELIRQNKAVGGFGK